MTNSSNEGITSKIKQAKSINPKRHPLRYLSHKYWARKPYNVVRYHIEHFTEKGDTVLDPFGGSGVTAFEALATGRKAYTIDLNPVATFISNQLVRTDIDLDKFEREAQRIVEETASKTNWVYLTKCPSCGSLASIVSTVFVKEIPKTLFVICENCGKGHSNPDNDDIAIINQTNEMKIGTWYPTIRLPENADVERVDQLFSRRNLYVLSELYDQILREHDEKIKDVLKYTFTANLATVSRLIPVNRKRWEKGILPSGMWSIKRYWIPPTNVENNVLYYFQDRIKRTVQAKMETYNVLGSTVRFYENYFPYTASATNMSMIDEATIDYIFADPPFGRNVEYFNLSTMWAGWLKMELDYSNELITNSSDKSLSEYGKKLKDAFSEMKRVLKDERIVSLAFHNRDLKVWQVLMDAVTSSGFRLVHIVHQPPAELSFTQMKMHKKAGLRGHFVYHFLRTSEIVERRSIDAKEIESIVVPVITRLMDEKGGRVAHEIYSNIIPILVNRYRIRDINSLEKDIDSILDRHFVSKEEEVLIWRRRRYIKLSEYVWRRIEAIEPRNFDEDKVGRLIRRYLREMKDSDLSSSTLDEIYDKIFRQEWKSVAHPHEFDRLPCLPKSKILKMIENELDVLHGNLTKFFLRHA